MRSFPFQWSSAYSVRLPEIDAEHRKLFDMADKMDRAVAAGADSTQLHPMLQEFIACAARHFAHEERLMLAADCPTYAWHKLQHDSTTARVTSLERSSLQGDHGAIPLLLQFLADWMKDHIMLSDRMMVACLQNHERAQSVKV